MMDEEDNTAVPFDQWKDELEIRASQHNFNPTLPMLILGIIALSFAFDSRHEIWAAMERLYRASNGKA